MSAGHLLYVNLHLIQETISEDVCTIFDDIFRQPGRSQYSEPYRAYNNFMPSIGRKLYKQLIVNVHEQWNVVAPTTDNLVIILVKIQQQIAEIVRRFGTYIGQVPRQLALFLVGIHDGSS
jgi:hypothetical protein